MILSSQEIKQRLRAFNETYDWSVFDDVPVEQHVYIMYPHLMTFGKTQEQRKEILDSMFGPLPENY